MEFIKNFLKKFDKKECYFYQRENCILKHSNCIGCNHVVERIEGIDETSEYLNFVTNRRNNRLVLFFTFLSTIISVIALIIAVFDDEIKIWLTK